jgi:hypothetical protein
MKRLLLLISSSLFISYSTYSQCTPDGHTNPPYIQPDSATNLPHAVVGNPYSSVIQVRVPLDTTSGSLVCVYDYVRIDSIAGLPPGYSYACNPSCTFGGNSNGCVLISGPAPPIGWAGNTYNLTVYISYTLHIQGFPSIYCAQDAQTTVSYYKIVVDATSGIESLSTSKFDLAQNKPNPFNRNTVIEFSTPVHDFFTLKVSNILGKVIYSKNITADRGINKITLSAKDFTSGIYFYTLSNNKNAATRRMIIRND